MKVWAIYLSLFVLVTPLLSWAGQGQALLPQIPLVVGKMTVKAEIARTSEELSMGLMFREKMADNDGMLFCLDKEGPANFWMANTQIPLSVAYIDRAGKILEIHDMQPLDLHQTSSTSLLVYYALEMNQGWFELNKVRPGEVIHPENFTLSSLRTAALPSASNRMNTLINTLKSP